MITKSDFKRFATSSLFLVIQREIMRIGNSWILIFTTLIGPVAAFLLVTWMFSSAVVRDLPISLVDCDHTQLSRKIGRMVDAVPAGNIVTRHISLEEAKSDMMKGEVEAILYLPDGMERSVQKGNQAEIILYLNNTNVVKGGMLQSQLVTTMATLSGTVKIQNLIKKGIAPDEAIRKAQPIKPDVHLLFNPYSNYAYFLMLGLLPLLAVVFIFLGTTYAIGIEMKEGTGQAWIDTAGNSTTVALLGKLIPYMVLFFSNLMVMNIILIRGMGTPLNGSLGIILISEFLMILTYQAMSILLLTITINLRLTLSLGSAYTMMALTFSGLTFPAMAMPLAAKIFSFIFPYTFWLKVFLSQSLRGEPVHETIAPLLFMLLFVVAGVLTFPVFKRRLNDVRWQTKE
jgi:ABC-2 type transport system permease protein